MKIISENFGFLESREPLLFRLAALAETIFAADPNTSLLKSRQFGEAFAQQIAIKAQRRELADERQIDLINILKRDGLLPKAIADVLHIIRKKGNEANHDYTGAAQDALACLRFMHQAAGWYVRVFHQERDFQPGRFLPPKAPDDKTPELQTRIAELTQALSTAEKKRATDVQKAQAALEEGATWQQLAEEAEAENAALKARLAEIAAETESAEALTVGAIVREAEQAAGKIELDEADTRELIDSALQDAGWEADFRYLRQSRGASPEFGRNMAIAEWRTKSGPVDYALFVGETCVGVIEAKRESKDVPGVLTQAERYARDIILSSENYQANAPFEGAQGEDYAAKYQVPFAFATNGRPYVKQIETKSGIWHRDLRSPLNAQRALPEWFSPQDLISKLEQEPEKSAEALAEEPFSYANLRPYQRDAVRAIENAIEDGKQTALISMATGTGKTRMAIALMYRLLKHKRFRRILFLVDRNALADQTLDNLENTELEGLLKFTETYGVAAPTEKNLGKEIRVHVATIQSMVSRVLNGGEGRPTPGMYDFIIVDEAHRGYALDAEMREEDIEFRSTADYLSKYRRVLEYFDAVKVGLTATPALQTTEIFGHPVFRYSYRQAVIDGFLIDHLPPKRIVTALNQAGVTFKGGEEVSIVNPDTGEIDTATMPDDTGFEVEAFNKKVYTPGFNKTVAEAIAQQIPPDRPGKTLIFAVRDEHADTLVDELRKALAAEYGDIPHDLVAKITGAVDRPRDEVRKFRSDARPQYVVTVDLLTTGVDIPKICNLVFVRRVNSRILYDQMIGRATRRCDEISKTEFRIYDAVDLYDNLQTMTEMRPVVTDPKLSFGQLCADLARAPTDNDRRFIRDQIVVKLRRRIVSLTDSQIERLEALTGEPLEILPDSLKDMAPKDAADYIAAYPKLPAILDETPASMPRPGMPIAEHEDELLNVEDIYPDNATPEDYIEAFERHVKENMNAVAGMLAVTLRPRELTRQALKELALALDAEGFSETALRKAYGRVRNADIAAHIAGFVRQAALGDPLVPYESRVENAMRRIEARRDWTKDQKAWLYRIGRALKEYPVGDHETFEAPALRQQGGWARSDKAFDGELESVLKEINEAIWSSPKAG